MAGNLPVTGKSNLKLNLPDPKLLPNQIADLLREEIVSGKLLLGKKLLEEELSSTLKVSRTPIRQAFRILELEGLVNLVPRRGAFVCELTQKDAEELYEVLGMAEGFAAEQLIANGKTELFRLEEILTCMAGQIESRSLEGIIQTNVDFHFTLVEMAGNRRLVSLYKNALNPARVYQSMGFASPADWKESLQDHRRIVMAIRRRNRESAVRLCIEHNRNRCKRVVRRLFGPQAQK